MNKSQFITGTFDKYPEELLTDRITQEGNVISCLWQDPLLIDETNLSSQDFVTKDGRFYFSLAKDLKNKGYTVLDEVTILSNSSETVLNSFNERGGYSTIRNLMDIVNIKNWESIIDNLNKSNVVLKLYKSGFNVLNPICVGNKEVVPYKLFQNMDSDGVLDWYENILYNFETGYSNKVLEEEELDITDEFIESLEQGVEAGVPFDFCGEDKNCEKIRCLPFLSNQISGFMDGTFSILAGYSSTGKTTLWTTILMGLLNYGRKILIISNEQKAKVFKINFIVWILYKYFRYYDLTKKKMSNGDMTEVDKSMLKKAQSYWRQHYKGKIKFISIAEADMNVVKKKIRQNVLQYGYDTVLYDTFKMDFNDKKTDSVWESLLRDSREFDSLAKKYNIIMLASLQLTINTLGKLFLDASVLSGSKQIKEVVENLFLLRSVYTEELDEDNFKYYCRPFQLKKSADGWYEEPYESDKSAVYKMLFVDKNRNGDNSTDTGVAYLLKFDGQHGIFKEVAQCRPKHGVIQ